MLAQAWRKRDEEEHRICSQAQWLRPYCTPRLKHLKSIRRASTDLLTVTNLADHSAVGQYSGSCKDGFESPHSIFAPPRAAPCGGVCERLEGPFADFSLNGPFCAAGEKEED